VTSTNPYILEELSTRNEGDSLVNLVYEYLLLENQEANFAINLIDQFGYPIWNHSTISPDTNNINYKVVITPFAKTDEDFISCYTMAFPIEGEIDNVEANEWLVYLFTREVLDSLVLLDFVEDPNTVFRVAQFVNYDSLLFGTGSEEYITWLQTVGIDFMEEEDGNLVGELDDRNGGMVFCTYIRIPCDENLAGELEGREKGCGFRVYMDVSDDSSVGDGTIGGVGYIGPSGGGGNSNTTNSEGLSATAVEILEQCDEVNIANDEPTTEPPALDIEVYGGFCADLAFIYTNALLGAAEINWIVSQYNTEEGRNLVEDWVDFIFDPEATNELERLQAFSMFVHLWPEIYEVYKTPFNTFHISLFMEKYETMQDLNEVFEFTNEEEIWLIMHPEAIDGIKTFTNTLSTEDKDWLKKSENSFHQDQIRKNLINYADDEDGKEFIKDHLERLQLDSEYKEMVESVPSWSGVMWTIAKELIGDKIVDIIVQFIPGFGNSDEIKDAIKAIKNGDWLEFTIEIGKLVVQNTPLGKLLKTWDAIDDLHDYYKKVIKIWDKIGNLSEQAIEKAWNIAKKSPLRIHGSYLKYLDDVKTPKLGNANIPTPMPTGYYRYNVYRGAFPSPELSNVDFANLQVHHAVPQAVANKYPSLNITNNQMHSLENLRGISNNTFHPDIPGQKLHPYITGQWTAFYNNNPNATLQQILAKTKEFDDEFGHLFIPPIR
jgi:hypothetical protein